MEVLTEQHHDLWSETGMPFKCCSACHGCSSSCVVIVSKGPKVQAQAEQTAKTSLGNLQGETHVKEHRA